MTEGQAREVILVVFTSLWIAIFIGIFLSKNI